MVISHLMRALADTVGPGAAVLLVAVTAGALVWVAGALLILWRTR